MIKYLILLFYLISALVAQAADTNLDDLLAGMSKADYESLLSKVGEKRRMMETNELATKAIKLSQLPPGVLIYEVKEEVLELSSERRLNKKTGNLFISPSKPKNVIYGHFMVEGYGDNYMALADRIDLKDVLENLNLAPVKLVKDKHLFAVLGQVELKLRDYFSTHLDIWRSIAYVGLAEDCRHRAYGHGADIVHSVEADRASARKVNFEKDTLKNGDSLRMSYLIENIPVKYLPLFECLVARLTNAFYFGASAEIGNKEAWGKLDQYWESDERNSLTTLDKNYLENTRTNLRRKIFLPSANDENTCPNIPPQVKGTEPKKADEIIDPSGANYSDYGNTTEEEGEVSEQSDDNDDYENVNEEDEEGIFLLIA